MTIKESYKLAEVIQKLRDQDEITLHETAILSRVLDMYTPQSFDQFHWFKVVNRKVLYEFKYLDNQ